MQPSHSKPTGSKGTPKILILDLDFHHGKFHSSSEVRIYETQLWEAKTALERRGLAVKLVEHDLHDDLNGSDSARHGAFSELFAGIHGEFTQTFPRDHDFDENEFKWAPTIKAHLERSVEGLVKKVRRARANLVVVRLDPRLKEDEFNVLWNKLTAPESYAGTSSVPHVILLTRKPIISVPEDQAILHRALSGLQLADRIRRVFREKISPSQA